MHENIASWPLATARNLALLATPSTIASGYYQKRLKETHPHLQILPISCPSFVPLIEQGNHHSTDIIALAHQYLAPCASHNIDTVLLACTHYPLVYNALRKVLSGATRIFHTREEHHENRGTPPDIRIINPGKTVAQEVVQFLAASSQKSWGTASLRIFVTGGIAPFIQAASAILPELPLTLSNITHVCM
jgi:glutamate racemase